MLSSTKYQGDVHRGQTRGYHIGLIFVSVYPPELILDRIEIRVADGGHNVDAQKALDRYKRSHANLIWFGQQADKIIVYDNSGLKAVQVAVKEVGKRLIHKVKGQNPSPRPRHKIPAKRQALLSFPECRIIARFLCQKS